MARLCRLLTLVLLLAACQDRPADERRSSARAPATSISGPRPNVVVIVTDDLRWDEFGAAGHPFVETPNIDRLAAEGALFINSFHAVPLCSPNRASLLTGQYPSRHGIIDNVARDLASHRLTTFPMAMREHGYTTAFLGKWHMGNDPTPRVGFDYWVGLPGQGRTQNPELFEDGRLHEVPGYVTDLLTDRAVEFIGQKRDGPFLLYLAHKAVHPDVRQRDDGSVDTGSSLGYIPAPRHLGKYDGRTFPRRPNAIADLSALAGKPALRRALAYRASQDITARFGGILDPGTSDTTIRRRAEMLLAVDESLGRIVRKLEELGTLDRTMVIFTSDNGFFFGEHGLSLERRLPYEESIRNPLLVRYPPLAAAGARPDGLVLSVDIAPTVLEAAGVPIGAHVQGRSILPLLEGRTEGWRQSLLVEFYTYENPMPWLVDMDYRAVRTARHKYIHWMKHPELDELYDLAADPYEQRNLIDDPSAAERKAELRRELSRLVLEAMGLGEF
ncbi:MAG TPA: sulfatase [Vicinamibacterales bacterium]|nr:sulfatase [Vicinamibacterales bacterium]